MIKDMKRRGFTIVELIIVITIMGILLTISVVNLRGAQANSRDAERRTDIETIATHLEMFYTSGNDSSTSVGTYPPTSVMTGVDGIAAMTAQKAALRDIDPNSLIAPGAPSLPSTSTTSLVVATNNTQTIGGVTPPPASATSQNQYVYQPIQQDGSLCTSGSACQKFNLYYMTEIDGVVQMVTSRNQ
jgi:prepilin-type N-terminal cleavage/methylation domain-containing protein